MFCAHLTRRPLLWMIAVCFLGLVDGAAAREVVVKVKGGRELRGELVGSTDTTITIRLSTGAERRLPRDQVEQVQEVLTLTEQYEARRAKVDPKDFKGRYEVAYWLYKIDDPALRGEASELALAELNDILKDKPDYDEALILRGAVVNQLKRMEGNVPAPPPPEEDAEGDDAEAASAGGDAGEPPLLTQEQINRMKVFEVDLTTRPRVVIPPNVLEDFLKEYSRDPVDAAIRPFMGRDGVRDFKSLEGYEQLAVMFDLKARQYYDKVQVRDEPSSLREFRTQVNMNYLIRYCGRCHGQGRAPGFYVITTRPGQEQTAYTNLMLAATTEVEGLPLILKDQPARSPLIQLGLPPDASDLPHKEVPMWKPYFRTADDPRVNNLIGWVESLFTDPLEMVPEYRGLGGTGGGGEGEEEGEQAGEPAPPPAAGGGAPAPKR